MHSLALMIPVSQERRLRKRGGGVLKARKPADVDPKDEDLSGDLQRILTNKSPECDV